jgi:hypothetical protein
VGGFERHFGKPFDQAALQRVPVQMVVGKRGSGNVGNHGARGAVAMYLPGYQRCRGDAPGTATHVAGVVRGGGVSACASTRSPNIAHSGLQVVEMVEDFLAQTLRTLRSGG